MLFFATTRILSKMLKLLASIIRIITFLQLLLTLSQRRAQWWLKTDHWMRKSWFRSENFLLKLFLTLLAISRIQIINMINFISLKNNPWQYRFDCSFFCLVLCPKADSLCLVYRKSAKRLIKNKMFSFSKIRIFAIFLVVVKTSGNFMKTLKLKIQRFKIALLDFGYRLGKSCLWNHRDCLSLQHHFTNISLPS